LRRQHHRWRRTLDPVADIDGGAQRHDPRISPPRKSPHGLPAPEPGQATESLDPGAGCDHRANPGIFGRFRVLPRPCSTGGPVVPQGNAERTPPTRREASAQVDSPRTLQFLTKGSSARAAGGASGCGGTPESGWAPTSTVGSALSVRGNGSAALGLRTQ
jgi:hypothetical protein